MRVALYAALPGGNSLGNSHAAAALNAGKGIRGVIAGRGAQMATGTSDCTYNLVSVLDHSLKGAQVYDQYVKDAEQEGNQELASFFREVQEEDRKHSDRAKKLLADHLTH